MLKFTIAILFFISLFSFGYGYVGSALEYCNSSPLIGDPITCQSSLVCDENYKQCLSAVGGTCQSFYYCNTNTSACYNSVCYDSTTDPQVTCDSTNSANNTCPYGYTCDPTRNTCRLSAGSNCSGDDVCVGNYACHNGVCTAPQLYDICNVADSPTCSSGLYCDPFSGYCVVPLGGSCNSTIQCGGEYFRICKQGTCQYPGLNQLCSANQTSYLPKTNCSQGVCSATLGICVSKAPSFAIPSTLIFATILMSFMKFY